MQIFWTTDKEYLTLREVLELCPIMDMKTIDKQINYALEQGMLKCAKLLTPADGEAELAYKYRITEQEYWDSPAVQKRLRMRSNFVVFLETIREYFVDFWAGKAF